MTPDFTTTTWAYIKNTADLFYYQYGCKKTGTDIDTVRSIATDTYLRAVGRYDPARGAGFKTYFQKSCKYEIRRYCAKKRKRLRLLKAHQLAGDELPPAHGNWCRPPLNQAGPEERLDIHLLMKRTSALERTIIMEIMEPSRDVMDYMDACNAKHPHLKNESRHFAPALEYTYGITVDQYRYAMRNLRKKAGEICYERKEVIR